jgi:hypothetical protein
VHAFALSSGTIRYARSLDGGRTWPLVEQSLGAIATQWASTNWSIAVQCVVRPNELIVVGEGFVLGPLLVRSTDRGTTWSPPAAITTTVVASGGRLYPSLHAHGTTLVVAWADDRPDGRVFANRSVDDGATWQPVDTVIDGDLAWPPDVDRVKVLGNGPVVNVFWGRGWTFHRRSLDGGATWPTPAATLPGGPGIPFLPFVAATSAGSLVLVVDDGGTMLRSADDGGSWAPVTNHGMVEVLDVAVEGSLVLATGWNGQSWNPVFAVNTSIDGGQTWGSAPLQLPSPTILVFPRPFVVSGVCFVQNEMPGFPGNALYSADAGATWREIAGPVTGGFSPGPRRIVQAAATPTSFGMNRNHAYVGVGSTPLGAGTAGTGGVTPTLTTVGLPVRGEATTLQVGGTVGGTFGALGISFAPPTQVVFAGAIVHLATLDVLVSFATGGVPGQPGTGSFGLPVGVPASPALIGASLVAQALVADAGAAAGFAATNAIELWLR